MRFFGSSRAKPKRLSLAGFLLVSLSVGVRRGCESEDQGVCEAFEAFWEAEGRVREHGVLPV